MRRYLLAGMGMVVLSASLASPGIAKDPKEVSVVKKFETAWNSQNLDEVMRFFTEDAVVKVLPAPPEGGVYTGKEAIRKWVEEQIPGFHIETQHHEVSGNRVSLMGKITSEFFRKMGVIPVISTVEAVVEKDKIKTLTPILSQETVGKLVVRRFIEDFNRGRDLEEIKKEFFTPDFKIHFPGSTTPLDIEDYKQFGAMFRSAFPDLLHTIETQVAEGERVVTHLTISGSHKGIFQGIPPTGKVVNMGEITIDRIVDGKIAERWVQFDQMGMMQQLGAIPQPGKQIKGKR